MQIIEYLRSFRAGPFAIFDFAGTYVLAYLCAPFLVRIFRMLGFETSRATWMYSVLPLAVFVHWYFSIDTPLMRMLVAPDKFFVAKFLTILSFVLAVRGFRRV